MAWWGKSGTHDPNAPPPQTNGIYAGPGVGSGIPLHYDDKPPTGSYGPGAGNVGAGLWRTEQYNPGAGVNRPRVIDMGKIGAGGAGSAGGPGGIAGNTIGNPRRTGFGMGMSMSGQAKDMSLPPRWDAGGAVFSKGTPPESRAPSPVAGYLAQNNARAMGMGGSLSPQNAVLNQYYLGK